MAELGKKALETLEESNSVEQKEEPVLTKLDNEIECSRCNKTVELHSKFDELLYPASCSFLLKRV